MCGEWREIPFSKAVIINPQVNLKRNEKYPFVDMQAISAGSRGVFASQHRNFEGGGARFMVGDTLMARITPCLENGKIARFCGDIGVTAHGSTEFIVIRGREGITETDYAYYLTKWDEVTKYAISHMTGSSGRQRVPTDVLDYLDVPVPPIVEQRAIAHILGTLDDKIELNRRMNETLEVMARALFKSWFVDFDPVRRNIARRDHRLQTPPSPFISDEIDALFPDAFEDSELGEIPKGWSIQPFSETITISGGGTPKTSVARYWNGVIPWFSVVDAPRDFDVWVIDTEKKSNL